MPEDADTDNGPKMIGFEMLQNMTDLTNTIYLAHGPWGSNSRIPPVRGGSREASYKNPSRGPWRISCPRSKPRISKEEQVETSLNTADPLTVRSLRPAYSLALPSRDSRKGLSNPTVSPVNFGPPNRGTALSTRDAAGCKREEFCSEMRFDALVFT